MSLWSDNVATVTSGKQACVLKWRSRSAGGMSAGSKEQKLVFREQDRVQIIQKSEVRSPTNSLPADKTQGMHGDAQRAVLEGLNNLDMSSFDDDHEDEEPFAIVHTPHAVGGASSDATVLVFRAGPELADADDDDSPNSDKSHGKIGGKKKAPNWSTWSLSGRGAKNNMQSLMARPAEAGGEMQDSDMPTTLAEWLHVFDKQLHDASHEIKQHRIKNSEHYSSFYRKRSVSGDRMSARSLSLDSASDTGRFMLSDEKEGAEAGAETGGSMGDDGDDYDDDDMTHECILQQVTRVGGDKGRRGSARGSASAAQRKSNRNSGLRPSAVNLLVGAGGVGETRKIVAREGEHIIGGRDAQTLREEGVEDKHLLQCPGAEGDGGSGVSRLHFEVFYSSDSCRFWLNDVHSKNGTYVRLPEQDADTVIHQNKFDWSRMHLLTSGYNFKIGELEFEVVWESSHVPGHTRLRDALDNRRHKTPLPMTSKGQREHVFFGELRTKSVGTAVRPSSRMGVLDEDGDKSGSSGLDGGGGAGAGAGAGTGALGGGEGGRGGGGDKGKRTHSLGARTTQRAHNPRQASVPLGLHKRQSSWLQKGGSKFNGPQRPRLVLRCTRVPKHKVRFNNDMICESMLYSCMICESLLYNCMICESLLYNWPPLRLTSAFLKDARLDGWKYHNMLHKEIEVDDRPEGIILGTDMSTYSSDATDLSFGTGDLLGSNERYKNHIRLNGSRPVAPQHCMIRYDEVHGFCLIAFNNSHLTPAASGTWVRLDPWKAAFPVPENMPEGWSFDHMRELYKHTGGREQKENPGGLVFEVDSGENRNSSKDRKLTEALQYKLTVVNSSTAISTSGGAGGSDVSGSDAARYNSTGEGNKAGAEAQQDQEEVEFAVFMNRGDSNGAGSDGSGGSSAAAHPTADKFVCRKLVAGHPQDAALGLRHYMGIDAHRGGEILQQGLHAIRAEFLRLLDDDIDHAGPESGGAIDEAAAAARAAAERDVAIMRYILDQPATEEEEKTTYGTAVRDKGHEGMRLEDFLRSPSAIAAHLEAPHVAALRLYTSQAFRRVNEPLRLGMKPHPFAATTEFLREALSKLRALNAGEASQRKVFWRGMRDLELTDEFIQNGGTEFGCMSTSTDKDIVAGYADSAHPLIFRVISDGFMSCGADISWLSLYPNEAEILYPPLTYLKFVRKVPIKNSSGFVVDVKPSFPT
jgi:hypothetical protein